MAPDAPLAGKAMIDTLIYVRRSYVKDGAPDISDRDQVAGVVAHLPPDTRYEVIADSYDENDPTSKRKHSGASADRDGYRELIRRVQRGGIARLGVYDLSRLNRDTRAMLNLKHELDKQGVHLLVANMPGSDFDTAAGRFQFGVMCMAAQYQRDLDSEKMRRATRHVFQSGQHNGLDPLGYRTVRDAKGQIVRPRNMEIVESEAQIIRRIFGDLASISFVRVCRDLNAEDILRRGERWTIDSVKDVWRRRRLYVGFVEWKRGLEERPGQHPAILDDETYRNAEMGVASRKRAGRANRPHRTYVLSGRTVHECGANMRGTTSLSRGEEWRYYRCGARCGGQNVRAEEAEQAVVDAIRDMALPARAIEAARDELARRLKVPNAGLSDKKRQKLLKRLQTAKDMRLEGDLTPEEYRSEKAAIEQQLAAVPDSDKIVMFDRHRTVILSLAESVEKASPERIKELVGLLVERVPVVNGTVDPERIVWTPPARPFFEQPAAIAAAAGLERPRRDSNPRRPP
jgi:DNA invertase Pin-like site-specific DNA recombinase